MLRDEILYWVWLADACGAASKSFVKLIERFESPFEIYSLESEEIEYIDGIGEKTKLAIASKSLEKAYSVLKFCRSEKIDIISYGDKRYPSRLRSLPDAPALLFCKGKFPDFNSRLCVAVVGTRKMSEYGKESAYRISYEMAAANVVVVSGMALGVDSVAACGAIGAGGETVAVLGSGVDVVYPHEHRTLYEKIARNGAVISEFMPSTRPERHHFPIRNRIISGLCQGILVIEGDSISGALITAKSALSQGREVFALPGKINESNSEGPNELIRSGAYVALSADDIIKHYDFLYHDVIDYRGLKKARAKSEPDEELIGKLEVSARLYKDFTKYKGAAEELSRQHSDNKTKTSPKARQMQEPKEEKAADKDYEALLSGLDEGAKRVFAEMPIDSAVSPDALTCVGLGAGEIITALTMLELCGLITSLPGGLYIRK